MEKKSENSVQFLIAEYTSISEKVNQIEEIKSTRINFFLLTVGAFAAGITAAIDKDIVKNNIHDIVFWSASILFALGLSTLHLCMNYSVDMVALGRRFGGIRKWFLKEDPELVPFLAYKPADITPPFYLPPKGLMRRGAEPVLVLLNSVLVTIILWSFAVICIPCISSLFIVLLSCLSGVMFFFLQFLWVDYRMRKEQKETDKQKESQS